MVLKMPQLHRNTALAGVAVAAALLAWVQPTEARLTRIIAGPATVIDLPAFGTTGAYLKIAGTFEAEVDAFLAAFREVCGLLASA